MLQIIALFCPGVLSMEVFDWLSDEQPVISRRKLFQRYASFTLLDVTLAIALVKIFHSGLPLSVGLNFSDSFLNGFYFVAVTLSAIFIGYAAKVLSSLFHIQIQVQTTEKGTKNSHEI